MDKLGLVRYCCRRMVLTHVDLIEKLLLYNRAYLVPYNHIECLIRRVSSQRAVKGQAGRTASSPANQGDD
jgi:hypothetical protein